MKKLFWWAARKLDKLKMANMKAYLSLMAFLLAINAVVSDPEIAQAINDMFGTDHWASRLFHIISGVIMALVGPRTQRHIQAANTIPPTGPGNGQLPASVTIKPKRKGLFRRK